jgi:hypothetical protein
VEQGIFMGRILEITRETKAVGELIKRFFEESVSKIYYVFFSNFLHYI